MVYVSDLKQGQIDDTEPRGSDKDEKEKEQV
jgi:hypothetical protein